MTQTNFKRSSRRCYKQVRSYNRERGWIATSQRECPITTSQQQHPWPVYSRRSLPSQISHKLKETHIASSQQDSWVHSASTVLVRTLLWANDAKKWTRAFHHHCLKRSLSSIRLEIQEEPSLLPCQNVREEESKGSDPVSCDKWGKLCKAQRLTIL